MLHMCESHWAVRKKQEGIQIANGSETISMAKQLPNPEIPCYETRFFLTLGAHNATGLKYLYQKNGSYKTRILTEVVTGMRNALDEGMCITCLVELYLGIKPIIPMIKLSIFNKILITAKNLRQGKT